MANEDPLDLVEMYNAKLHKDLDDPPVSMMSRQAFEDTWKPKGYALTSSRSTPGAAGPKEGK